MFKTMALLAAAAAVSLAACGGKSYSSSSSNTSTSSGSTTAAAGGYGGSGYGSKKKTTSASSGGVAKGGGEVEMYNFYFKPKTIVGKPGQSVKIKLKNEGAAKHNFKIDGQKLANADVPPGGTGSVTVKIPASGTLQFYCEYHKALGMTGTVKVA